MRREGQGLRMEHDRAVAGVPMTVPAIAGHRSQMGDRRRCSRRPWRNIVPGGDYSENVPAEARRNWNCAHAHDGALGQGMGKPATRLDREKAHVNFDTNNRSDEGQQARAS